MFIFSNLATSLDGKIATRSRALYPLGTPADRKQMDVLRRKCEAVLIGASTLRAYKKPCVVSRGPQPLNVILSSALEGISPRWPFFTDPRIRRLLLVGAGTSRKRILAFQKSCDVVILGKGGSPSAKQIVGALKRCGIKKLLVEGGGGVMWEFVRQNLIDEFHVTLTPKIVGGRTAPTLVDGMGFEPRDVLLLQLQKCRILGDELYLTYRKTSKRGL